MRVTRRLEQMKEERGAAVAMVVLSLVALLGMLVLVVDLGGMLTMRRRMVGGTDAAALASAQSCARQMPWEARQQADQLAVDNEVGATVVSYSSQGCTSRASSGTVSVRYKAPIDLQFAPVLGFPDQTTVGASATAQWGPAGGIGPLPIVISLDQQQRIPCVWKPVDTPCNYWYDNNSSDFSNSANWGFINLNAWDVAAGDSCPSAGTDERRDWINSIGVPDLSIAESGVSYVCADTGHSTTSWFEALQSLAGTIHYFPVNDPAQMVLSPAGREKYAIIGFTALKIERVLRGNDPAAIGTPGRSGSCAHTMDFSPGDTIDLDTFVGDGCPGTIQTDAVANLLVQGPVGSNIVVYQEGSDFLYDPATHVLTWRRGTKRDVTISFDWNVDNIFGTCGLRQSDPNAVCLVASWQGAQVGGTRPGGGQDFGLRAIRLSD